MKILSTIPNFRLLSSFVNHSTCDIVNYLSPCILSHLRLSLATNDLLTYLLTYLLIDGKRKVKCTIGATTLNDDDDFIDHRRRSSVNFGGGKSKTFLPENMCMKN